MNLLFLALLAGPAGPLDLNAWSSRIGAPLPAGVEARVEPDGLLLLGAGETLALTPLRPDELISTESVVLGQLLDNHLRAFKTSGIKVPTPRSGACTIAGKAARCLTVRVEVAPGMPLDARVGRVVGADWVASCLDRKTTVPGPCADLFPAFP